MAKINVSDLDAKIRAAGIPIHGVSIDGRIDFDDATDEQKAAAAAIVNNYDQATVDAAKDTEETAKRADLGELVGAKLAAATTANANDLAAIDTATAAEVRTIVKRMLTREAKYIKFLSRLA